MARSIHINFCQWLVVGLLVVQAMAGGLSAQEAKPTDEKTQKYSDDKFDFSITVPTPWKSARLQDYAVPGVARVAYSGDKGASIVVFMQETGKDFTPRYLVDESAKGLENGLGATVKSKEVRSVSGKQAMWMVVQGKGTGGAIDGKGDVATTQHWVAIPREKDIVVILLTSSSEAYEKNAPSFEKSLKTLVVGGKQTAAQSESK